MPSPYGSQSYPSQYPYPPQPAPVRQSTYSQPSFSSPTYAYPGPSNGPDPPDRPRIDETRKYVDNYPPGEAYGNSVRRHLDIFDLEASLAGIMDGTARLFHWAEHYRQQTPVRMPRLEECKEMLDRHRLVLQSLTTMEDVLQTQEKSRANQQNHNRGYKNANDYDMEDSNGYADDLKTGGVGEGKKRRGRAAPPGRCHSCNRAETPEWRRGPDGARTLCNACGLHYAKLTRKTKASGGGGSSFRAKSIGPSSP
ncbi:MAG: hypothetical protein M1824_004302 [Vezdaea acicularis]|nr:MAG: hypothetical protein M1824_004302 [Vezdaea acicularis]